jgi:hypothetical protein
MRNNTLENVSLVLILAIVIGLIIFYSSLVNKRQKSSSIIIMDRIRQINEYASHEITYTENISHEEIMRLRKINIPFMKKGFCITILGKVKLGIDNANVSVHGKNVYITIPEIKIIGHDTKIMEPPAFESNNPFFQNKIGDYEKIKEEIKNLKEQELLRDNKLIETVYEDLRKKIEDSLMSLNKKFKLHYIIKAPTAAIVDRTCSDSAERLDLEPV